MHDGKLVHGGCVFSKAHFIKTLEEDRHNNACKATGRGTETDSMQLWIRGLCNRTAWKAVSLGRLVWGLFVFVVVCYFFFLCNDAPKANVDGVAERSWGLGVRGWGLLCCRGAD